LAGGIFVTGTDTDVGKTWFCRGLMAALQGQGRTVCGMKPVASGANARLVNEDALQLRRQSSIEFDYQLVNPFVYRPAIAPHIAAELAANPVSLDVLKSAFAAIQSRSDLVIVEGIGGWRVPLSGELFLPDLVRALRLPVIMVVGLRVGCLNHAILTAEAIMRDNINLLGWAANCIDPDFQYLQRNLATLEQAISAPLIAQIPYLTKLNVGTVKEAITNGPEFDWDKWCDGQNPA